MGWCTLCPARKQHGVEGRARSVVAVNLLVAADKAMVSAAAAAFCRSTLGSKLGGGDGHWAEVQWPKYLLKSTRPPRIRELETPDEARCPRQARR